MLHSERGCKPYNMVQPNHREEIPGGQAQDGRGSHGNPEINQEGSGDRMIPQAEAHKLKGEF